MIDEATVFAYIDGELEGEERARVEAAIEADPVLQALVAQHRALGERLQGAFATVADAPAPAPFGPVDPRGGEIVSLESARASRKRGAGSWGVAQFGAMAATLIAGLVGGAFFTQGQGGPVVETEQGLIASGQLERALSTQLASAQRDNSSVRVGLTFRNHAGQICRSFTAPAAEGVACRDGESWRMQGLFAPDGTARGEYRMAASSATADLIDGLIEGEALDREQEAKAKATGWGSRP